jgi:hypothetical protein
MAIRYNTHRSTSNSGDSYSKKIGPRDWLRYELIIKTINRGIREATTREEREGLCKLADKLIEESNRVASTAYYVWDGNTDTTCRTYY